MTTQDKAPEAQPEELLGNQPATEGAPTEVAAEPVDTLPSLEEQLRQMELKVAEHHDAWLRAKAEAENVRRRAQEDITKAHKFAVEKFAGELLAVKDSLEAALATQEQTVEAFKAGVELTLKQLVSWPSKRTLWWKSIRWARSSIPTSIRPSAWWTPNRKPTPWSPCCKRAT